MSDLTDNQFYPSAERIWLCIRLKMPILAKKIIISDEAHFDLVGYVYKQNCRPWGTENPHAYIEKSTHPKRVTVWCGFWSRGKIEPFFFENEQLENVTVNGDHYRSMLNEFLNFWNLRKYLVIFFKAFSKKIVFDGSCIIQIVFLRIGTKVLRSN